MPDFPPFLRGIAATEPRVAAVAEAQAGCEGGTVFWRAGDVLEAAIVLAPDVPLTRAAQMLPLTTVALRDALGAIGPAELPVHLTWDGRLMVNGAEAGRVRLISPPTETEAIPDWLVAHFTLRFFPDGSTGTALLDEGCGEVEPVVLLESWSRHLLHRLADWEEGPRNLHAEMMAASWELEAKEADFLGLSEDLGRLRRDGESTRLDPLTDLLETA